MKFEPKISGTKVTEFDIKPLFHTQIISLKDCMKKIHSQKAMDFLLDTFRFSICEDGEWRTIIDFDTDLKLAVLENYPNYEREFINYFGNRWFNNYIRFNH